MANTPITFAVVVRKSVTSTVSFNLKCVPVLPDKKRIRKTKTM